MTVTDDDFDDDDFDDLDDRVSEEVQPDPPPGKLKRLKAHTVAVARRAGTIMAGALGVILVCGFFVGATLVGYNLYDAGLTPPKNPGVIDQILFSKLTIFAIRLTLIALAVYVIGSIITLIYRQNWLKPSGHFDVLERLDENRDESEVLLEETIERVNEEMAVNAALRETVRRSNAVINELLEENEELTQENDALRRMLSGSGDAEDAPPRGR